MNVIAIDRPGVNHDLMSARGLTQQFSASDADIASENRVPVLGHPDQMMFAVPKRCGCRACTLPSNHFVPEASRSQPPKGVGFRDPLSGTLKRARSAWKRALRY